MPSRFAARSWAPGAFPEHNFLSGMLRTASRQIVSSGNATGKSVSVLRSMSASALLPCRCRLLFTASTQIQADYSAAIEVKVTLAQCSC